ncbi:MAG: hypothetical protein LC105_12805 [Chitinophagales bacterium]|nr:hypothetical protein [Chitinophagales bacterium]MCZ2394734.1 hypothetical protein [Chitinophagales bacterium]
MQKETYFYPSSIKNIEELTWLNKSDTTFLWIYRENLDKKEEVEQMMINKLIENPRVLNSNIDSIAILKFTGKERFHFLAKHLTLKKIVLLGIQAQEIGIQIQIPEYEIVQHLDFSFLKIDSPEQLSTLNNQKKILLAQKLIELNK